MQIARFRQPALSALAVLLLSGASVAFAGSPTGSDRAAPARVEAIEPAGADTDTETFQEGDQTTPDEATEATGAESEGAADAAAQHADCLKVGINDTTTPNVEYDDQTGACSLDTADTDEATGAESEATGAEAAGTEADGPGGHADDPNDADADHEFDGEE